MLISSVATWSLGSLRLRRSVRLEAIALVALVGGALFTAPWETLSLIVLVYLALIPFSMMSYARIMRQRLHAATAPAPAPPPAEPVDRPRNAAQGGENRRPMRLQRELQYRRQRDDEAEEEDDRERVSHSFSPDLSTAKSPRGP